MRGWDDEKMVVVGLPMMGEARRDGMRVEGDEQMRPELSSV